MIPNQFENDRQRVTGEVLASLHGLDACGVERGKNFPLKLECGSVRHTGMDADHLIEAGAFMVVEAGARVSGRDAGLYDILDRVANDIDSVPYTPLAYPARSAPP